MISYKGDLWSGIIQTRSDLHPTLSESNYTVIRFWGICNKILFTLNSFLHSVDVFFTLILFLKPSCHESDTCAVMRLSGVLNQIYMYTSIIHHEIGIRSFIINQYQLTIHWLPKNNYLNSPMYKTIIQMQPLLPCNLPQG